MREGCNIHLVLQFLELITLSHRYKSREGGLGLARKQMEDWMLVAGLNCVYNRIKIYCKIKLWNLDIKSLPQSISILLSGCYSISLILS